MSYSDLEVTNNGYLANPEDWTEDIAREIAAGDGIPELTEKHFDLLNFLRDEFQNNNGNQPNERSMVKAMSKLWGEKIFDPGTLQPVPETTVETGHLHCRAAGNPAQGRVLTPTGDGI